MKKKKPLFTLGNVFSTSAIGPSKQLKQVIQIEYNINSHMHVYTAVTLKRTKRMPFKVSCLSLHFKRFLNEIYLRLVAKLIFQQCEVENHRH